MSNHPNRGGNRLGRNPSPHEIRAMRDQHGLTVEQAAALVYANPRTWAQYELDKDNPEHKRMHPAAWELFQHKLGE